MMIIILHQLVKSKSYQTIFLFGFLSEKIADILELPFAQLTIYIIHGNHLDMTIDLASLLLRKLKCESSCHEKPSRTGRSLDTQTLS